MELMKLLGMFTDILARISKSNNQNRIFCFSELQIDMSVVCLPERYPGGKNEARVGMYINDTAGIVERVLDLAGYKPFKFFIQIAYLERVLAFSGESFSNIQQTIITLR